MKLGPPLVLLAACALPAALAAQDLPATVDDPGLSAVTKPDPARAGRGWACTPSTLLTGAECVFAGAAAPERRGAGQKQANLAALHALARDACRKAALPDASARQPVSALVDLCVADAEKAAQACAPDRGQILDAGRRFTPEARACYFGFAEVLQGVARLAATGAECCRCAVARRCAESARACFRDLSADRPIAPACEADECHQECSAFAPPRPEAQDGAAPARPPAVEPSP